MGYDPILGGRNYTTPHPDDRTIIIVCVYSYCNVCVLCVCGIVNLIWQCVCNLLPLYITPSCDEEWYYNHIVWKAMCGKWWHCIYSPIDIHPMLVRRWLKPYYSEMVVKWKMRAWPAWPSVLTSDDWDEGRVMSNNNNNGICKLIIKPELTQGGLLLLNILIYI